MFPEICCSDPVIQSPGIMHLTKIFKLLPGASNPWFQSISAFP
ncbi:MAG: hypothetical protein RIQ81_1032 [Pseudomonadota bacterium]